MPPSPAGEGFGGGRFVKRPYEEMGNRDLIRPSVRTGAPSPPGEGFAGCRGRQPLQEYGAAGRPLRHPAGRDTPGDISPCAGEVIRAAEDAGPYGDMGGRTFQALLGPYGIWVGGARSPSPSPGGRTRRLTAPPEGEPRGVRSILARGPLRGTGGPF